MRYVIAFGLAALALVIAGIGAWRDATKADQREAALRKVNQFYDE